MPSAIEQPEFHIPTVDISAYLADPLSAEAQHVVGAVRLACTTSGFFQLVGHGIQPAVRNAMFSGAKALFKLSFAEKKALKRAGNRGYEVMGSQALQDGTLPDLKEGYYIGEDSIPFDAGRSYRPFMEPNIWPSEDQLPSSVFKNPMNEYYAHVSALNQTVMEIVADALPYGSGVFDGLKQQPVAASMRLLHYPPQRTNDEKQLGAGAHTDFGITTLLLTDGHPGLEVLNQSTGQWVAVPPNEDAYVVNVGDMLQQITGGYFKSNVHRVLNLGDEDRYSVPYFFDGCLDARLARLDGKDLGKVLTVEEHMTERFATTYGRGEKKD
ncbi:Isopenicillin N synthase [Neofusicoccum parvum]|nr:Isopenicillin N synthase [Neofusicoccum parvum]